jgi:RNA polymerase sigma factor (sigma-70 family)
MSDDRQLLRRFAADRSETAFGELVTRHVTLVYSAALRQTGGDEHRAKDIAQIVFTDFARKAPALSENVVLAGWLHRATIFAARQNLRGERRRRAREQEAVTMNAIQSETENDNWQQIRPLLDEALDRLNKTDRDALLLRFFEQQSLAQVGENLGGSEDAARKRIARALEKLRAILTRNGVTTTAAALSTVISANAIQVAPTGLAATLTNASLAVAGTGTTFTFFKIMTMTKLKLGFSALVVAGATTALVVQHQTQIKLREDNQILRQQAAQQIAQLQNDNETLSNRLATIGDSKQLAADQFDELLKLRGEVGVLRQQLESQKTQTTQQSALSREAKPARLLTSAYISKDQLNNVGFDTPEAALETWCQGILSGNYDQVVSAMSAQISAATLNDPKEREGFEKASHEAALGLQGMQIVAKKIVDDKKADLEVLTFQEGKAPELGIQHMVKEGNQWKFAGSASISPSWDKDGQVQTIAPSANQ